MRRAIAPPHEPVSRQCHVSVCVHGASFLDTSRPLSSHACHLPAPPLSPAERCHIERSHHTSHVPTHTSSSNASSRAFFRCGRRPLPEQWTCASGSDRYTREAREGGDLTQTSQPCEARPRCAPPAPAHARPALPRLLGRPSQLLAGTRSAGPPSLRAGAHALLLSAPAGWRSGGRWRRVPPRRRRALPGGPWRARRPL